MSLLVWLCLCLTLSLYAVSSLSWFGSVYVSLYHSMLSHLSPGLALSMSHSITLCCLISLLGLTLSMSHFYHSMLSHLSLGLALSMSHSITLCCLISLLVWLCLCLTLSFYASAVSCLSWFGSVYVSLYHSMLSHLSPGLALSMSHSITLCCLISLLVWLYLSLTLSLYAVSSLSWFGSVYVSLYHSMLVLSHVSPGLALSISHSITLCCLISLLVWLCLCLTLSLYAVSSLPWFGSVYLSLYHSMLSHLSPGLALSMSHFITLCCLISPLVCLCLYLTLSLYAASSLPWFVSVYVSLYKTMLSHLSPGLALSISHSITLCCLISLLV